MRASMLFGQCLGRVVPLSAHDVSEILEHQAATRRRFGEIALAWGLCRPQHVWQAWWAQLAQRGSLVFADIGYDETGRWDPSDLSPLTHCHAFTPNALEAMAYTRTDSPGAAVRALADKVPLVVVSAAVMKTLARPTVAVIGAGEALRHPIGGQLDLTTSGAAVSGPIAFEQAGVRPSDIKYASIYDSFTITVLMQLEDLGFCAKGEGGRFVADGNLIAGSGQLPVNTDGGGLCNNHPANRGGITKVIEAVRQLRGEAHPAVQVKNCSLALAQGTGGLLGTRHGSATVILERE